MAKVIVFTDMGELVEREAPPEQYIVRIGYTTSWTELVVFGLIIIATILLVMK